jgi:transposase
MGKVRLSAKERRRLEVLAKVKTGGVTLGKAAELLGMSYRQVRRVYGRYAARGSAGLKHGLRDRASNHRLDADRRTRVLELYETKYGDFGPTLAAEYLAKADGEVVGVETLRQWLVDAGLWEPRRKGAVHRKWRERKKYFGEMVQMDGSHHDWFEGRRDRAVLMVLIDDATNRTYARFFESETTAAAMTAFGDYVQRHGLPHALYVDRDSIYETTREATVDETLANAAPLTQFGRAMTELGVELILAHSPQAKGRVERRHGVFQDRLVKALRLKGISTLEEANAYLEAEFLPELNARFTVPAAEKEDLHRRVPRTLKLAHVLSFQEERVVQNDWTISWNNRWFQLDERHRTLSLTKQRILVSELLDGTIRLVHRGRELSWRELPERPPRNRTKSPERRNSGKASATRKTQKRTPLANHPWRKKLL